MTDREKLEDKILRSPQMGRITIAQKVVDGETVYRFVNVFGTPELGYIASSEEWFSPNRKGEPEPEFYEVLFQSPICNTIQDALNDAVHSARQEAENFSAN